MSKVVDRLSGGCTEDHTEIINYNVYLMTVSEKVRFVLQAGVFLFLAGLLFYNNIILALLCSLAAPVYLKFKRQSMIKKRRGEINLQFRDALYSISSALNAGLSLENCFRAASKDLRVVYPDEEAYIIRELKLLNRRLEVNIPIEDCLYDLSVRSGSEDISNFANIIAICKRTGGNLVDVVKNSSSMITEKIDISNDLELMLTKQKFEQKLLNFMPVIFIGIIKFGSSGYMAPLYASIEGYFLMTAAYHYYFFIFHFPKDT